MRFPVATAGLLAAMLIVRAGMDMAGVPATDPGYVAAGARDTQKVLEGEGWRLFSSTLMHAGWKHLLYNSAALLGLGFLLENVLGPVRFLLFFLLTAAAGHVLSMALVEGEPSLGSSGGVYGLCGVLLALLVRRAPPFSDPARAGGAVWLLAAGVVLGLVHGFVTPDIDGYAHLGGLVAGLALGSVGVRA